MHKAQLARVIGTVGAYGFNIMIAPNAVRLVGFRACVLGQESISQDCHCVIPLAGGTHWHLQAPGFLRLKCRCSGIMACPIFVYWVVAGLPSLVKVLAILPTA